jgi:hypothetical protein
MPRVPLHDHTDINSGGRLRPGSLSSGAGSVSVPVGAPTDLSAHVEDATDAHDASAISILDTGGDFTATDVEGALAELYAAISGGGIPATIFDAAGDIIVATAADTAAILAAGSEGEVLTIASGVPSWEAASGGALSAPKEWVEDTEDPRDYPGSPDSTYDDEFNDASGMSGATNGLDARWNWRNQGSATATFGDAGWLSLNCPASSSANFRIIEIAGFADGTYEARVSLSYVRTNDVHGGIVLVDATNGDLYFFGLVYSTGPRIMLQRWNSVSSFNSTVINIANELMNSAYLRIVKSGTSLEAWASEDGRGWQRLGTLTDAVTPTRIGLGVNESNNAGLTKLHVDYFRKVA